MGLFQEWVRKNLVKVLFLFGIGLSVAGHAVPQQESMRLTVSKNLLQVGLQTPVSQSKTIADCIRDTAISGTAFTSGYLTVDLIPSNEFAWIALRLSTQTQAYTLGHNSPRDDIDINISSTAFTQMGSVKSLFLVPNGISTSAALSTAQSTINYQGINVEASGLFWRLKTRIAERRAWAQAWATKASNEQRLSQMAEREMNATLDNKANVFLGPLNRLYQKVFFNPIFADKGPIRTLHFSTTSDTLSARIDSVLPKGAIAPPAFTRGSLLALRLHESVLTSYLSEAMAKKTSFNEEQLEEFLMSHGFVAGLSHYPPNEAQVTFKVCSTQPVSVSFHALQIELNLCTEEIEFRGVKSPPTQIKLTYTSQVTPDGSQKLWRIEEPELSVADAFSPEVKAEILKRLGHLFPEQLAMPKMRLPGKFGAQGDLSIKRADLGNEWLVLEYWYDQNRSRK